VGGLLFFALNLVLNEEAGLLDVLEASSHNEDHHVEEGDLARLLNRLSQLLQAGDQA